HTRWPRDWSSDVCSSDLSGVARPGFSYKDQITACDFRSTRKTVPFPRPNAEACAAGLLSLSLSSAGGVNKSVSFCSKPTPNWSEIGRASCREREESALGG